MKSIFLIALTWLQFARAADVVTILWDSVTGPDTHRVTDYKVYVRTNAGPMEELLMVPIVAGGIQRAVAPVLAPVQWYAITAVASPEGLESGFSDEVRFERSEPPLIFVSIEPVTLTNGVTHGFVSNNVPGVNLTIKRRSTLGGAVVTRTIFDADSGDSAFYVLEYAPGTGQPKSAVRSTVGRSSSISIAPPVRQAPKYQPSKGGGR